VTAPVDVTPAPDAPAAPDEPAATGAPASPAQPAPVELTLADLAFMKQESCAFFASETLRGPQGEPYNGRFLIARHHEEWSELIVEHGRLCIEAARDHGKTFFFDFAYPIWMAEKHPNKDGFIFSASQPQAERILGDIAGEIETNPKLRHLMPKVKQRWSSSCIQLANGHKIYARGYGTKVRGAHPVWVVVDDGLNDDTAYSEKVRQKEIDYFYNAITNMVIPGGQIIVVGTPFHRSDLYAQLEKNTEYFFKKYPAIQADGTALWPERYDLESLETRKQEIGSVRFSRELLCEAISDGSTLFPKPLFLGDPVEQTSIGLGMPLASWERAGVLNRFMGVDFGLSSSVGADYTVVWTMGIDGQKNRWIVDIQRERGLAYEAQKALIVTTATKYKPGIIFVESNQAQRIFGTELIRETDLPIKLFHTGESKHSQMNGVPSLRILLENRKYRIPRGDARSIAMTDEWIDEMQSITVVNGKVASLGEHDDMVMANWICERAIEKGSFAFSFSEEEGDAEVLAEMFGMMEDEQEEMEEDSFVLGALPQGRGRPRRVNAQLADGVDGTLSGRAPAKPKPGAPMFGAPPAWFFSRGGGA
jgi:hypothetical protein